MICVLIEEKEPRHDFDWVSGAIADDKIVDVVYVDDTNVIYEQLIK